MGLEIFKMMGTIAIDKEQALRDISVVQRETEKSTKAMGKSFSKFTTDHKAAFKAVGMAAVAAGVVISLAVKKVGSSFDVYESALVDMGKITDESLESIENRMKELPPILGSLTDLTRGYYQIVSAGIRDPIEAIDTLTISAQTAAAAHVNQSEVVKGLTKVMAGYKGEVKDVSEAADLMFAIEKEGQTTVAELIPSIGGLATASSNLKISQDEMGASMAVITRTAGNTGEAVTQYEGVLLGLMKPTEQMIALINKWEFATASQAIEELGFVEVLRRVKEEVGDNEIALGELFGRKSAIMGITKLTTNEMETLTIAIDSVSQKVGMADKAYQDWTTTGEAFNQEQKAVTENLLLLIGKAIDPMMDVIQRRMIETIKVMGEWITKNEEMAASIGMWTGGIGMLLVPFGALMMMLPGLVIALPKIIGFIGVLSTKFATLAIGLGVSSGGLLLVLAGLTAVGLYIGNEWKKAFEESKRIKEMEIESAKQVEAGLKKLREAYNMTDKEMQYWIENGKLSISVMARVREETRLLSEEKYGLVEVYGKVSEAVKEAVVTFEELDTAILNSIIKGKELSEQQEDYMALRQRMSDIDRTATQRKIDDLDRECIALIVNMETNLMTMEQIDEYRKVMLDHIIAESSERQDYLSDIEEAEKRLFELSHTQVEIQIEDLKLERDARIEAAEAAMLSIEKREEAIIKYKEIYEKEKTIILENVAVALESAVAVSRSVIENLDKEIAAREKAGESIVELTKERIEEEKKLHALYAEQSASVLATSIAQSKEEISSLNQAIARRGQTEIAIDSLIAKRNAEIANLAALKAAYSGAAIAADKLTTAETKRVVDTGPIGAATEGQYKVLNAEGGYEGVTTDVNALTPAEAAAGWQLIPLEVMKFQGGGLVQTFVEAIKRFAGGGGIGTDTVPIMATPGEYVIKKSMVDFIRKTGMITGGLIQAIQKGMPTPSPAFAGGGMVGSWSNSSPSGGEFLPSSAVQKSGGWIYNPVINVINPIVGGEEDLIRLKELMEDVLEDNANVLDLSGNEIGG